MSPAWQQPTTTPSPSEGVTTPAAATTAPTAHRRTTGRGSWLGLVTAVGGAVVAAAVVSPVIGAGATSSPSLENLSAASSIPTPPAAVATDGTGASVAQVVADGVAALQTGTTPPPAVGTSSAAAAGAAAAGTEPTSGRTATVIAQDTFTRTVASGWGTADSGVTYAIAGVSGGNAVTGGQGVLSGVAPGQTVEITTSARQVADVRASVNIQAQAATAGNFRVYGGVMLRKQAGGAAYIVRIVTASDGSAALDVERRNASGVWTNLIWVNLPRTTGAITLDTAVVGNQVYARAYPAGGAASAWSVKSDTAPLPAAGSTGLITYVSGSSVTATESFDNLAVWALTTTTTTPPTTTPPTTTPTTSTPPSPTGTASPVGGVAFATGDPSIPPTTTPPTTTPPTTTPPTTTPPTTTPPTTTPPTSTPPTTPAGLVTPAPLPGAGAAPLGTTNYPVPAGAVFVAPNGDDVYGNGSAGAPFATVVKAARALGSSGTIVLRGGTYHQSVALYSGDYTISAYPGEVVWFDGSVPVTGWRQVGTTWVHDGWDHDFDNSASFARGSNAGDFINPAYPLASHPDQVFFDGVQLQQVASNPREGQFVVDDNANTIIVGTNPNGRDVRASDLQQAFLLGAKTRLLGFGVRRYATSLPQIGTIFMGGASDGSLVQNVIVSDNATQGLTMTRPRTVFDHVTADNNGMTGICSTSASDGAVTNSLITRSNSEHFNAAPSAAGMKILRLDGFTVRGNTIVDNYAVNGIWLDENVTNFAITGNYVADNGPQGGISAELSGTGSISGNAILNSRYAVTILDSGNIQVVNNTIVNSAVWGVGLSQDDRWMPGRGTAGPSVQPTPANNWKVENVVIANNVFPDSAGYAQIYVLDKMTRRPASSMNLMVWGNAFTARTTSGSYPVVWGLGDNVTTVQVPNPTNLPSIGQTKPNTWFTGRDTLAHDPSITMGLPAAIATSLQQATGAQHFGIF